MSLRILFNGIPSSGKSTFAYWLHLQLEHNGNETIYLDDEVIKRLDAKKVQTLIDFIDSPITVIASCDPHIDADIKFWCTCSVDEAIKRNVEKMKQDGGVISNDFTMWEHYYSEGIEIDTEDIFDKCVEVIKCALKKKNLNF